MGISTVSNKPSRDSRNRSKQHPLVLQAHIEMQGEFVRILDLSKTDGSAKQRSAQQDDDFLGTTKVIAELQGFDVEVILQRITEYCDHRGYTKVTLSSARVKNGLNIEPLSYIPLGDETEEVDEVTVH